MWFGTYFGVMRYDGYQWQKIELPESMRNKFVSCITTSGNKVYAGFLFGGGLMEWHEGKVRKIPLPIGYTIIKYLVTDTDGSILICAAQEGAAINHGVWRYSDQGLKSLWRMKPGHVNVSALSVDHKGRIWIGTAKGLLILNKNNAVDSSISEKPVSNITRNADETMMVCYESKNSLHLDFYSTKSRTAVIQKGWAISDAVFPYLAYNPYNGAWGINTNLELIHTEEKDKSSKFQFDIPQKTITGQLFIDRERNIWLSTEVGTYKFYNLRAQSYRFDERGPSIASISSTGRKKLFSNGYSLFRLRNGSSSMAT